MIPAGGRGKIEVTLKTGYASHRLTKNIYVYCNDPKKNIIVLTIEADVQGISEDKEQDTLRGMKEQSLPQSQNWLTDILGLSP